MTSVNEKICLQVDPKLRAEMQQMMNMMKNYKNRLFLANHGKRSVPMEVTESDMESIDDEEILDDEELAQFFAVPNGFFFSPKLMRASLFKRNSNPILMRPNSMMMAMKGKRGNQQIFVRPNGFLFPKNGKRSNFMKLNPNGFNFPMGGKRFYWEMPSEEKRAAFDLDIDDEAGNFFGHRGKRYTTFSAARGKKADQ